MVLPVCPENEGVFSGKRNGSFFNAILYGGTEMTHCSGECECLPVFVITLSVLSAEFFFYLRMKMRISLILMKRRSRKRKGKRSLDDALAKRKCMSIFFFFFLRYL